MNQVNAEYLSVVLNQVAAPILVFVLQMLKTKLYVKPEYLKWYNAVLSLLTSIGGFFITGEISNAEDVVAVGISTLLLFLTTSGVYDQLKSPLGLQKANSLSSSEAE